MWYQRKASKYGNVSKIYNGRAYDSKLEAKYAQEFDLLIKSGEFKEVIPQYKISLDVNGKHICNYYVDFKVITKDDEVHLYEIKGFETAVYQLKRKLLEATYLKDHPEAKYIVYKQ